MCEGRATNKRLIGTSRLSDFPVVMVFVPEMNVSCQSPNLVTEKCSETLFMLMLDRLSRFEDTFLIQYLKHHKEWTYAAICSGSACPAMAKSAICRVSAGLVDFDEVHGFWQHSACEIDRPKRGFIMDVFPEVTSRSGPAKTSAVLAKAFTMLRRSSEMWARWPRHARSTS